MDQHPPFNPNATDRCSICRTPLEPPEPGVYKTPLRVQGKVACERCVELYHCPMCLACGERVRNAKRTEREPYHDHCRRCSSCHQIIAKTDMHKLAGKLLCGSCSTLFGHFFCPERRPEVDHLKESFSAWDVDDSGFIEQTELERVLKALDPNFLDTDIHKLVRIIDKNGDGRVDFNEFCEWVMQGDPLELQEDSFESYVNSLMHEAGSAAKQSRMDVAEVHVRPDGMKILLRGGEERFETKAVTSSALELACLDPEEFIDKIECTERGLSLDMNTGRIVNIKCQGEPWGPWVAPDGFHIIGIRAKMDDGKERIVGVDVAPLPNAKCYDALAALRFAAEHEFLQTLRGLLSKGAVNVNGFSPGGVTALMLAAQNGNSGSMRMLLGSKAQVDLTDADGWTALTFASRYGQTNCVSILLEKGASQEGDGGGALRQALYSQHNSAARALLRAGFGPAPSGTFALEDGVQHTRCSLPAPTVSPVPAAYSGPVTIEVELDKKLGDPLKNNDVRVLYSLDGRDPMKAGRRYKGPITVSNPRNHFRGVVTKGTERSQVVDAMYVCCHYAMPNEAVKGSLVIRTFPQAIEMVKRALSMSLGFPKDRVLIERLESDGRETKTWLTVNLRDPLPRHRLTIDRPYTLVRGAKQKDQFTDHFKKDVHRAVGGNATGIEISAGIENGGINVDFTLEREYAEEIGRQLGDNTSFLHTRARAKAHFREARLSVVESLGDRLADHAVREGLRESFSKKATVVELLCMGTGDTGVIATLIPKDQLKMLKKGFEKAVKDVLPDCVQEGVTDSPEDIELAYTIDVVSGGRASEKMDGGVVVKDLNCAEGIVPRVDKLLSEMGLPVNIAIGTRATSRPLNNIEFRLAWDPPRQAVRTDAKCIQDFPQGVCMIYDESHIAQVVDFRLGLEDSRATDSITQIASHDLGLAISRAVTPLSEDPYAQGLNIHLDALPPEATDVFIMMTSFEADSLGAFPNLSVQIFDSDAHRKLTEYTIDTVGDTKAAIMCSLTRPDGRWVVNGLALPCEGHSRSYDPIHEAILERQDHYLRWERRQHIIKLRVMHKANRITEASTNDYAEFLWRVLKMPIPLFQLVVRWL